MHASQRDYMTNDSKQKHLHEFEMQFLSRESSRKHVEMQEGFLEQTIRKESSKMLNKKQSSQRSRVKVQKIVEERQGLRGQGEEVKTTRTDEGDDVNVFRFQFNFFSYLGEVALAYGLLIGICYLIKAKNFPYFQLLLTLGLLNTITPFHWSNLFILLSIIITIVNYFLRISVLSYPAMMICYLSVMLFNERNKIKMFVILVLVIEMAWGFGFLPGIYSAFEDGKNQLAFYYVFPIFMIVLRVTVYTFLRIMKYTELLYLQLPLFMLGLEYGVILTLKTGSVQYWYLMVFFTLSIINDRTQFLVRILSSIFSSCRENIIARQQGRQEEQLSDAENASGQKNDISLLAAHASGYSCIHSFHIICLIYIFTQLPIYSSPYTDGTVLLAYTEDEWYIPLATWALATVYEIMCLVHERRHRDRLLIGHTKNTIPYTILRAFMLTLGFWFFYLGLGVGNFIIYPQNTRYPTT